MIIFSNFSEEQSLMDRRMKTQHNKEEYNEAYCNYLLLMDYLCSKCNCHPTYASQYSIWLAQETSFRKVTLKLKQI